MRCKILGGPEVYLEAFLPIPFLELGDVRNLSDHVREKHSYLFLSLLADLKPDSKS